jgi:hypothetical protein
MADAGYAVIRLTQLDAKAAARQLGCRFSAECRCVMVELAVGDQ